MKMRQTIGLSLALLVVSTTAIAKEAQPGQHQPVSSIKSKPAKGVAAAGKPGTQRRAHDKVIAQARQRRALEAKHHAAKLPPPDEYIGPLQVIGRSEIGSAAWYGGRHLGQRTASGDRLDVVHATAAHRSLPLHSLVRVTNLSNGRSCVARITDRGPVSHSLLIDLSPKVAERLDMMRDGIVKVSVEPVALAE